MIFNETGEAIDYRIIDGNNAFLNLLGKKAEEIRNRLATDLYSVMPAPYIREYESVVKHGQPKDMITF